MYNCLSINNAHSRDADIQFIKNSHKYIIKTDINNKYTSVTSWIHCHFPKFDSDVVIQNMCKGKNWNSTNKYWNMSIVQIKQQWKQLGEESAILGTRLHEHIEQFMNNNTLGYGYLHKDLLENMVNHNIDNSIEWNYFIDFIKSTPHLKPYRTEWFIFDEDLKLAGSIDMVYENEDGTLSIYDWKRCKEIINDNTWNKFAKNPMIAHIPDINFWHYTLQLNTYKCILERKYNKQVTQLCLVKLHPENTTNTFEIIDIPILINEMKLLFTQKENNV